MQLTRRRLQRPRHARAARGFSIVELMVGVTVGLFLLAGATTFFVDYLNGNRRLLLETRVNQDLRTVADLIARDLRRAGYWQAPIPGVTRGATTYARPNPYIDVTNSANSVQYSYSRDTTENNVVDVADKGGFRLSAGAIEIYDPVLDNWQALTNPAVVTVTRFQVAPTTLCVSLTSACKPVIATDACSAAGLSQALPRMYVRRYQIELAGTAKADSRVSRQINESVRVRNDQFENIDKC